MGCFVNSLKLNIVLALGLSVLMFGCATSDSALRESGHVEAYLQGFHDGRHSGMREAGNYFEHIVKDAERFTKDTEYREGWLAGEEEGVRIQQQANLVGGTYSGYKIGKEVEKSKVDADAIGKDVMKGVDTDSLKNLK